MSSDCEPWKGLKILWSLKPVPRAKHFIWLVFKGKIKTANFLYALNLRPQDLCIFCGLNFESAEHILNLCPKVQAICNLISNLVGKTISFPNGFISGVWSETDHCVYPNFVKSVVVGSAWYIWKTRCNVIFRHEELDFNSIPRRAYALSQEYYTASNHQKGKNLILLNFSYPDSPFLFLTALFSRDFSLGGAGFFVTNSNYNISLARCCQILVSSEMDVEIKTLLMQCTALHNIKIQQIFTTCTNLQNALQADNAKIDWGSILAFNHLRQLIISFGHPRVHIIPKSLCLITAQVSWPQYLYPFSFSISLGQRSSEMVNEVVSSE